MHHLVHPDPSRVLEHELRGRQPLILYANSPHFQQTTAVAGELGEGVGGVTEMFKRRIVLPMGPSLADTDHVIGHELVHAFQLDVTAAGATAGRGLRGAACRETGLTWARPCLSIYTRSSPQGGCLMLVLSRREHERIRLGDSIVVTVVRLAGDKVRLGIEAPAEVVVLRDELAPRPEPRPLPGPQQAPEASGPADGRGP